MQIHPSLNEDSRVIDTGEGSIHSKNGNSHNSLSQTNTASQTNGKQKRESPNARLSLGGFSSSDPMEISRPMRQTTKRNRPDDLDIKASLQPLHSSNRRTSLPLEGPFPSGTLFPSESTFSATDHFLEAAKLEPPRTPLLFEGQITPSSNVVTHEDYSPQTSQVPSLPNLTSSYHNRNQYTTSSGRSNDQYDRKPNRTFMEAETQQKDIYYLPVQSGWNTDMVADEASQQSKVQSDSLVPENSESGSRPPHSSHRQKRSSKDRDKKTMLALALQRANDAVQLDNVEDFVGAINAYIEACEYLTFVMDRSSSQDDRTKLSAIKSTYTERIREISQIGLTQQPDHTGLDAQMRINTVSTQNIRKDGLDIIPHVNIDGIVTTSHNMLEDNMQGETAELMQDEMHSNRLTEPVHLMHKSLKPFSNQTFVPAPLSPRRPSPQMGVELVASNPETADNAVTDTAKPNESASDAWQDGFEERVASSRSSSARHSLSSLHQLRRKHLRAHSTNTEAEFDAALDAAVEAAYDDSYGTVEEADAPESVTQVQHNLFRNIQHNRDPYLAGRADRMLAISQRAAEKLDLDRDSIDANAEVELNSEEEDELLNNGNAYSAAIYTKKTEPHARMPRQSDSSSSSGRTWGSSVASSMTTLGTSLSPVDENMRSWPTKSSHQNPHPSRAPPPTTAPPLPPGGQTSMSTKLAGTASNQGVPSTTVSSRNSVQDRRLSGQKGKRLKIETFMDPNTQQLGLPNVSNTESTLKVPLKKAPASLSTTSTKQDEHSQQGSGSRKASRGFEIPAPYPTPFQATFSDYTGSAMSPPTPSINSAFSNQSSVGPSSGSMSPNNLFALSLNDKNVLKSTGSTLSLRSKGLLTPNTDAPDSSPVVLAGLGFSTEFNNNIPLLGEEPQNRSRTTPRPLEPCPEAQILRPYWLLRCFHQTIIHPDGGYLTNKLCIPREIWQITNVKLKHVDEKVASCDLLTAALLKVGLTDTFDADAVLQEMESFEAVMTQVQTNLTRRLGNDVGSQNIAALFKEAPVTSPGGESPATSMEAPGNPTSFGSNKSSSKGYFMRKLRGRTSDATIAKTFSTPQDQQGKDGLSISSVPMTSSLLMPTSRGLKKDERVDQRISGNDIRAEGPYASYTTALARLCDAAQVLDQVARQVEDPGLKHSSPTHVGLELSSKHASEFFGLYICRFVLQDIMVLAEKHIKRASEFALN